MLQKAHATSLRLVRLASRVEGCRWLMTLECGHVLEVSSLTTPLGAHCRDCHSPRGNVR
jgi:hypothetical protein